MDVSMFSPLAAGALTLAAAAEGGGFGLQAVKHSTLQLFRGILYPTSFFPQRFASLPIAPGITKYSGDCSLCRVLRSVTTHVTAPGSPPPSISVT